MASVYDLKPAFQRLLRPFVRALASAGATPNQVTVAALVGSLAVGAAVALRPEARWSVGLIPPFLFVRMALNAIDGMLAREHGMQSRLGAFLNEIGDVLSDAALYLPLALVPGFAPALVVAAVVLAGASELAGVVAAQVGGVRRYDGPMGKSDRAVVLGATALAIACGAPAGRWVDVVLGATCALLVATIVRRARADRA